MDRKALPRSPQDLPAWPSSTNGSPNSRTRASHTLQSTPLDVQDLTRRNLRDGAGTAELVVDDALPGIPAQDWLATPPSPSINSSRASKRNSVELGRPANRRSRPYHDGVYSPTATTNGQFRHRTRTLEDDQRFVPRTISKDNLASPADLPTDAGPGPIGYPSTIPYRFSEPKRVSQSSEQLPQTRSAPTKSRKRSIAQNPELTIPRTKRLCHMMRVTQGRMAGVLTYRRKISSRWHTAYCAINPLSGSLMKETGKAERADGTLCSNLRGCRARCFREDGTGILILEVHSSEASLGLQLRCNDEANLFWWQAAFLCWQPVTESQVIGQGTDTLTLKPVSVLDEPDLSANERMLRSGRQPAIQKVGKLLLWGGRLSSTTLKPADATDTNNPSWKEVSCMIKDNGDFVVTADDSKMVITTVHLSMLSRSAIQRLHPSAYEKDHLLAVIPQNSRLPWHTRRLRPVLLSCPSREILESWYVLLQAFAVVELYGPAKSSDFDILRSNENLPGLGVKPKPSNFRVERSLLLSIGHFEDKRASTKQMLEPGAFSTRTHSSLGYITEVRVEIRLEGLLRAQTRSKPSMAEVMFYEEFEVLNVPAVASSINFRLVESQRATDSLPSQSSRQTSVSDQASPLLQIETERVIGECTVALEDISKQFTGNRGLSLNDENGEVMGTLSVKPTSETHIMLADKEYAHALSDMVHNFNNGLTIEIADRASTELTKLSRVLLNIFQVSKKATEWLMSLAEEEIDGIRKEAPAQRERNQHRSRLNSNESKESLNAFGLLGDRADAVRDMGKTVAAEANLLFRGNTLLSKALDYHMQRLGKDYLERTLGSKLRTLMEEDVDLEVDPARASATASLQYNSVRLTSTAKEIWQLIFDSAADCPTEIRAVLRYVKACAEDKFGDILRNAKYSAVSGFIFLRFFCPAILNPPLFGLMEEALTPRSQRNCTLLAKSIQGLANQTTFGAKEPWMEPMNKFVFERKAQFRDFIDKLCDVPYGPNRTSVQPSQAAAQTIFTRLPSIAQEGIPALPFCIDPSRAFAALVKLWAEQEHTTIPSDHQTLQRFHHECLRIYRLTQECVAQAERTDIEGRDFTSAWALMAKRMEMNTSEYWDDDVFAASTTNMYSRDNGSSIQTIDFAPNTGRRRFPGRSTSSRPSTSPGRPDDDGGSRSLKGAFRFRSRSRSRPSSRQQVSDSYDDDSANEEPLAQENGKQSRLQKDRPNTADRSKRRFWQKRESEKACW